MPTGDDYTSFVAASIDDGRATTATRVDHERGLRVDIEFLGSAGSRMIGFRHSPVTPARAGMVLCSSIHAELMSNYRKEVLLASRLAEQGIAVQRFHYRGTGNSEGSEERVTLDAMQDDARTWAEHLKQEASVEEVGFFGMRFGALVAGGAAASFAGAPVALWQPVVEPMQYFREISRVRRMRELKAGRQPTAVSLTDELAAEGMVDVLGYTVQRTLYNSTTDRRLTDELGPSPRRVLLVQIERSSELNGSHRATIDAWRQSGWEVATQVVVHEPAWWFVGEDWKAEEIREETVLMVDTTVDWAAAWAGRAEAVR